MGVSLEAQTIKINEILASNYGSITNIYDEEGDSPDYIELYNPENISIDVSNWKLVDSDAVWIFPANTTILAKGYLTVWASGKNKTTSPLHTNFKLDKKGEYLGLYDAQGKVVDDFGIAYPQQYDNISYGVNSLGEWAYFATPTKDNTNATESYKGKVATPTATMGRGFYNSSVQETLTCATPTAQIRFSTDGIPATATSTLYTSGITLSSPAEGLVTIRARAYLNGYLPSDEVSWSYVFPTDLFSANALAREGMSALPVISIQYDDQTIQSCFAYEPCDHKTAFIEWLELDSLGNNQEGFSEYGGVNLFGESSLNGKKRNFRVHFDTDYNNKQLEYPLFKNYEINNSNPTKKFRKLELKGGYFDSYEKDKAYQIGYYITENWWRSTVLALGGHSMHSRFVHLFVNGVSRGIYTLRERFDHHNYASYKDVDIADVNTIRFSDRPKLSSFDVQHGDSTTWKTIKTSTDYDAVKQLINPASFLAQSLMESLWEAHQESEFRVVGTDNHRDAPYQIINNDLDFTFSDYEWHRWKPSGPLHELPMINNWKNNPEFVQDAYEFTARSFCQNGPLSEQEAVNRLDKWATEISAAMHSEIEKFAGNNFPYYYDYAKWQTRIEDARTKLSNLDDLYDGWAAEGLYNGCDLRPQVQVKNKISSIHQPVDYVVDAYDPDGDVMSFSSSTLPPGLSIDSATGKISGAPSQVGIFEVVLQVEDTNKKWGNHYFTWEITDSPPVPTGIVINEIMYHPDSLCLGLPTDADEIAYIELTNTSQQTIDLSRSKFTDGVDFEFPIGTSLPSGGFYVIAASEFAFYTAYGFYPDAIYKNKLNKDGERLELSDAHGNIIDSLTYNDAAPWDDHPDGNGTSLELIHPSRNNSDPLSWIRSDNICGTPAQSNSSTWNTVANPLKARVLLEGFYEASSGKMHTKLADNNLIPLTQPFNKSPWNYTGTESVPSIPTGVVDWILIMTRDATGTILNQSAGFVNQEGELVGVNGTAGIPIPEASGKHISIHHQSHLAIITATPYTGDLYDLTIASEQAQGAAQLLEVSGKYLLYGGDYDASGIINSTDFNQWKVQSAVLNQYLPIDGDGNGIINAVDYNLWINNRSKVGEQVIRY